MQVSNSMGYSQRWRQFNKTTWKDPKSLNLCTLVQLSMQFMQLGLHLSCLCKQFSPFASMNLPCLCVFGLLLYRPDVALLGLCSLMFVPGCFSVDQNMSNFWILAWLYLLCVFTSLLVLISHFSIIHSFTSPVLLCLAPCMSERLCSPKDFIFPSSKILKVLLCCDVWI